MPDLDPQELANTILDQAQFIRQLRDANQSLGLENAQLRDSWNRIELVKARYDDLKAQAEATEAKEVATTMTAEKPVATIPVPSNDVADDLPRAVESAQPGPSRPDERKRGR